MNLENNNIGRSVDELESRDKLAVMKALIEVDLMADRLAADIAKIDRTWGTPQQNEEAMEGIGNIMGALLVLTGATAAVVGSSSREIYDYLVHGNGIQNIQETLIPYAMMAGGTAGTLRGIKNLANSAAEFFKRAEKDAN